MRTYEDSEILTRIYRSTLSFLEPLSLEERFKIAVEEASKVAEAEYGSIFLGDKNGELVRVYSNVPAKRQAEPRERGYSHKSFVNGKLYIVTEGTLKKIHKELYDKGVKSLIIIPLSFNYETIGVLTLQSGIPQEMDKRTINVINLFGSLISLGIRNSQLYEKTIEAVESRDLFISLASHELKTPLTTISAYADLISKKINSKQVPSEKSLEVLNQEIKRLKHMLNELLAIDQVKTGQLSYSWKELNITKIIKSAIINFKFSYPGYKVFFEDALDKHSRLMQGDPEKLQQVFTNLLNNAAKFSIKTTPVVISLFEDNNMIGISVTDYGSGIRKNEQYKVFQEFFKAQNNRKEGMGLGLYLVKGIIEKHHGTVTLLSRLNKGTTISIKLPKKLYG